MSTPDFSNELTNELGDAATTVDPGDGTAALAEVRKAATRSARRRRGVMGIAAVGALVAGGTVVATLTSSDGDNMIVSSPAPEQTEPISTEAPPEDEAPTPGTNPAGVSPVAEGPLLVRPSSLETVTDDGLVIEQQSNDTQLYPWKGGFLAIHSQYLPQSLPAELPPEISEQFPQEVLDLFPDGLPPTLDEATEILQEAGLYDVVSEIVLSSPEVSEAIYSEQSNVVTTFRFSEDGVAWDDIPTEFPVDLSGYPAMTSTGDRFVVAAPVAEGADGGEVPFEDPTGLEVWSSSDLVSWERQYVQLPSQPEDLPEFVQTDTFPAGVAASDEGWVVMLQSHAYVDAVALLDDETRARAEASGGWGSSTNETGVVVEIYDDGSEPFTTETVPTATETDLDPAESGAEAVEIYAEPEAVETIEFTWDELGLDGPLEDAPTTSSFTARWGEDPQETTIGGESGDGFGFGPNRLLAIDSGFVASGSDLQLSTDGVQWSPVQLPDGGYIEWLIETDSGLLVSGSSDAGMPFRLLFDPVSSEFSPVDFADAPETGWGQPMGSRAVVIEDYGEEQGDPFGSFGTAASIEMNGYLFELESFFTEEVQSASYVLTDVATGEVVSSEELDFDGDGDGEFEFAKEEYDIPGGLEGFRVFDPESGEVLIEVPFEDFEWIQLDADGEPIPESEFQIPTEEDYENPDRWLIASVGDSVVVEQLDGTGIDTYVTSVAVQGDVVLVARNNGAMTRIVAEG